MPLLSEWRRRQNFRMPQKVKSNCHSHNMSQFLAQVQAELEQMQKVQNDLKGQESKYLKAVQGGSSETQPQFDISRC